MTKWAKSAEAEALPAWHALGFGFTELGAVTWHAQPGNPKPRVFRAIPDQALVNRMGFNNPGAEALAEGLPQQQGRGLVRARVECRHREGFPQAAIEQRTGVEALRHKIGTLLGLAEELLRSLGRDVSAPWYKQLARAP